VFNSGILATGAVEGATYDYKPASPQILERVRRIEAVCRAHGVALADAAMRFALAHPAVASLVMGAVKPEEVARNLRSMSVAIPGSLWADLKTEKLLPQDAPTPA